MQSEISPRFLNHALYVLGEGYLELGDEAAARRIFEWVEPLLEMSLKSGSRDGYLAFRWYVFGERYLELDDEAAARRVYRQLLENFPDSYLHSQFKDEMEERFLRTQ